MSKKRSVKKTYPVCGCNYYRKGNCSLIKRPCDQLEQGWRGCPHRVERGQSLINERLRIPEAMRTRIVASAATLRAQGEVPPKTPSRHDIRRAADSQK